MIPPLEGREPGAEHHRALVLACVIYALSMVLLGLSPFFLGMYVDQYRLSLSQAGMVQAIDQLGSLTGALAGFYILPKCRWRNIVVGGGIVGTAANFLTGYAVSVESLCVLRFIAGFGVVLVSTVSVCILARAEAPDRLFGVGLAAGTLLSSAAVWILSELTLAIGFRAGLGSAAAWLALSTAVALLLPANLGTVSSEVVEIKPLGRGRRVVGLCALGALFLFGVGTNVVYGFVERAGLSSGLDPGQVAEALSFGYLLSVIGSATPIFLGRGEDRLKWILFTTISCVVSLWWIYDSASTISLAISSAVFVSSWNMGLAFYMSLVAANDATQSYSRLINVATVASSSAGSAFAAAILTKTSLVGIFAIAPLALIIAATLVTIGMMCRTSTFEEALP